MKRYLLPGALGLDSETWDTSNADSRVFRRLRHKRRVPHPWHVFVFAPRVGYHESQRAHFKRRLTLFALLLLLYCIPAQAQRTSWRQATDSELASLLPARAAIEREHIETEMRTASGIVNSRGRFIAGVVLLTAGYSAEGKYSHYLVVQAPIRIGGIALKPGEYVFGWTRAQSGDVLRVHFHEAATGAPLGTADAHRIVGSGRVESLHIWPPGEKAIVQIGRFGIPYELGEE
jgi:hypothetical protein